MPKTIYMLVDGVSYPCRMTLGAMLRFKRETGREVSEIAQGGISDIVTLIWCCTCSACKADGIQFNLSLEDFCDNLEPDELEKMTDFLSEDQPGTQGESKKK